MSFNDLFLNIEVILNKESGDAKRLLKEIIVFVPTDNEELLEDILKTKETAIYSLCDIYVREQDASSIRNLFSIIQPVLMKLPKARMSKLIRTMIDLMSRIQGSESFQVELCFNCLDWCDTQKLSYLRHRVMTKLCQVFLNNSEYTKGLNYIEQLIKEVKKIDDKLLLLEIYLTESKLQYNIRDLPKAKAALTASRTNVNSIHCPPILQADIDLQSGILLADEGDYRTAYSYFYEAFEAFNIVGDSRAIISLKYMMLSKIMSGEHESVGSLLTGKNTIKFQGKSIDCLKMLAKCRKERSLKLFEETITKYTNEIDEDSVLKKHINMLYENLFQENIQRILESYSEIEIQQLAVFLQLTKDRVHDKLIEMILDKVIIGSINENTGVLSIFNDTTTKPLFENILSTFSNSSQVVDILYSKAALTL